MAFFSSCCSREKEYKYVQGEIERLPKIAKRTKRGSCYDGISAETNVRKYTYDDLQQMTREIIIEPGATTGKQYDFEYDLCGNILSKTESTYTVATGAITGSTTKQYAYNDGTWKDLLSAYGTRYFTYDEIGNLRSIKNGSNTSGYYFNWGKGRQLESLTYGETAESADLYFEYGYNADGIRISKAILGRKLEYIVDGDKILKQVGCGVGVLQTLEFYYDALGEIIGFNYANQDYYFGKNLQGDVVELYQDGTLIATYEYDAWGKVLSIKDANGVTIADDINSTHVASINPIRYRGYYYDIDKKMYYLNSRYYYPEIGRFISADGYVSTGQDILGTNMFAYCGNNPVNREDPTGQNWVAAFIVNVVAVAVKSVLLLTEIFSYFNQSNPRSDLANAPDLDINTASPDSYNCYGNGIGKQIATVPTGYNIGDSTEKTFIAVEKDLGKDNVRKLDSINASISDDEFKVAMKCGPKDFHFIRLDDNGWYNKSGLMPGVYIHQSFVTDKIWFTIWEQNGFVYMGDPYYGFDYYDDTTIYFAVKKGWDVR